MVSSFLLTTLNRRLLHLLQISYQNHTIHSPTWLANDIELVTEEENYKQELENTFTHIRRKKVDGLVDATIQELNLKATN